ncbi:DUF2642 domain-containing protein [Alkalihalobacillus sp. LMS6]|uniref:DUF2642 domain-containing protein n=1 Tax=Bacillaceae TaxID=186817 RepID=UPI000C069AC6|nr:MULTISPECIES: DUF2642 domain-containing protein [Bacillaceae]UTR08174.1 DUF2642 domain-containing protein [Alkalihalobacillus sp. LMS6]
MFKRFLYQELSKRLTARVEVTTDTNLIEGMIVRVTPSFLVIDVTDGYEAGSNQYIFIDSINYVRFPQAA